MRLRRTVEDLRRRLPHTLLSEHWSVLVPLVLVEWGVVALIAGRARHNGWLFYHGASATWGVTTGWIFGGRHIPQTFVGYGLPFLDAPVTWITGPNFVAALPAIVLIQVLVLLPLGLFAMYVLGARSGGRVIGYACALIWAAGPWMSTHYFHRHPHWLDMILPAGIGLTALGFLPATLALVLAAVLVLRALDDHRVIDAAGAGVAAGFAIAIKPTNILFLLAPLVAFAAARRVRELGAFAAAVTPCILTYLLWRERGLGHIGSASKALLIPVPMDFDWHTIRLDLIYLQSSSWSPRALEWIAVAGFVGLLKRSPVKALFFGTWVAAYAVAEALPHYAFSTGVAFWHLLMPAFPAYAVLIGSIPLLWPRAHRLLPRRFPYQPRRVIPVAAPALFFLVAPLAAVAVASPLSDRGAAVNIEQDNVYVPIDGRIRPNARVAAGTVTLSWQPVRKLPAKTFYAVYRSAQDSTQGVRCVDSGATRCILEMDLVGRTRTPSFSEEAAQGPVTYRVAVLANYLNDKSLGSPILISPPLDVQG
jgi:hypothetical protein